MLPSNIVLTCLSSAIHSGAGSRRSDSIDTARSIVWCCGGFRCNPSTEWKLATVVHSRISSDFHFDASDFGIRFRSTCPNRFCWNCDRLNGRFGSGLYGINHGRKYESCSIVCACAGELELATSLAVLDCTDFGRTVSSFGLSVSF